MKKEVKKQYLSCVLVLIINGLFVSCHSAKKQESGFTKVEISTVYEDSISIRAILIDSNQLWFAGNKGKYGAIDLETQKVFNGHIVKDSLSLEFRSIAKSKEGIVIASVGSPALLYHISSDKKKATNVFQNEHENVFFNSMQINANGFGVILGDPTEGCLDVWLTHDFGMHWEKIPCHVLPDFIEGEAAFAASNSNVSIKGNTVFVVTGGKKARCWVSEDQGKSWKAYETPIVQGEVMTGIFTSDFYNENLGIVAGGDYEKQVQNFGNKAMTTDGGKTWKAIAENSGFGYASCIQFVPNTEGEGIVCVGGTGVFYSSDSGKNWQKMANDKELYTLRFLNNSIAYAAGRNKIIKLKFQ
jgi:photosystem II stability/assembly factor-like uncharacterized protein